MIRVLNPIENAFTFTNEKDPLSIVITLHLENGPVPQDVQKALSLLQNSYPLLSAFIERESKQYVFKAFTEPIPLPFKTIRREHLDSWRSIHHEIINSSYPSNIPLLRVWYFYDSNQHASELLLNFHHAIVDGKAAERMLQELLALFNTDTPRVPSQDKSPMNFSSSSKSPPVLPFLVRMVGRQVRFKIKGVQPKIPPHSINVVRSLTFSQNLTEKLQSKLRSNRLTMNSFLLAVFTEALVAEKYETKPLKIARLVNFVRLRSIESSSTTLGCNIAMMQLDIPYPGHNRIEQLASNTLKAIFRAGRRKEILLMHHLSKYVIRAFYFLKNQRMGQSALSYIGTLDLESSYGETHLKHVQAFIPNNRFGTEISAFGKLLFGALSLDFSFLKSEWSEESIERVVLDIRNRIQKYAETQQ